MRQNEARRTQMREERSATQEKKRLEGTGFSSLKEVDSNWSRFGFVPKPSTNCGPLPDFMLQAPSPRPRRDDDHDDDDEDDDDAPPGGAGPSGAAAGPSQLPDELVEI